MGHGRIISGADSSARLSGSHPPGQAPLGSGSQAWTQPPGPARPEALSVLVTRLPASKVLATRFRPGIPGQLLPHLLRICAFQQNSHPLSQPVVPFLWLRPKFTAMCCSMLPCSVRVRQDAQHPDIQDISPPLRILGWAGSPGHSGPGCVFSWWVEKGV